MSLTMQDAPQPVVYPKLNSAHVQPSAPQTHENQRSPKDFKRAARHSFMVAILKKVLPVSAALIVFTFAGSAILSWTPQIEGVSGKIGLEGGKLVMDQPKMAGFDKNKRAFNVTASKAIQDLTNPDVVELESIDAKVPLGTTSFANVDAGAGTYDTKSERLNLRDNVRITGARGMDIALEEADIDMKTGTMTSDQPVNVVSKDTTISANSVQVQDNGKRIIFKERVRMTIKRSVRKEPTAEQSSATPITQPDAE